MSSGIRQRVITYDFAQKPAFLSGIAITVTEGIVEIEVLKESGDVYATASIDAQSFKTDAQFLIEEIEECE